MTRSAQDEATIHSAFSGSQSVEPQKISSSLDKVFRDLREGAPQQQINRAAGANLLIPLADASRVGALESMVDSIAQAHPARVFLCYPDNKASDFQVVIAARCFARGKNDHVCSEIVRIGVPPSKLGALPSVIRGSVMLSKPTEIFLLDADVPTSTLQLLLPLADSMYLDSGIFEGNFSRLHELSTASMVDLQWVALGAWRDQIKAFFDVPACRSLAFGLETVTITATQPLKVEAGRSLPASTIDTPTDTSTAAQLLLAGWVTSRLGLTLDGVRGSDALYSATSKGLGRVGSHSSELRTLRVALKRQPLAGADFTRAQLFSVVFTTKPSTGGTTSISFRRAGPAVPTSQSSRGPAQASLETASPPSASLETVAEPGPSFRASRPLEDESTAGLLTRYFSIGESITNYGAALRGALELARAIK